MQVQIQGIAVKYPVKNTYYFNFYLKVTQTCTDRKRNTDLILHLLFHLLNALYSQDLATPKSGI